MKRLISHRVYNGNPRSFGSDLSNLQQAFYGTVGAAAPSMTYTMTANSTATSYNAGSIIGASS